MEVPRGDGTDHAVFHGNVFHCCVEQQGDVRFPLDNRVEHIVPDGEPECGVEVVVFQQDLFQYARFFLVFAMCAADPHADFTGCVAAEHGTVLHQNGFESVSCRRDCGADARHAAADYDEVR